jgi:hypothetical protein
MPLMRANGQNTINISIGDVHSKYYVGIDLHDCHVDEVQRLKTLIMEVEKRKEHTNKNIVESSQSTAIEPYH